MAWTHKGGKDTANAHHYVKVCVCVLNCYLVPEQEPKCIHQAELSRQASKQNMKIKIKINQRAKDKQTTL